jgi:putative PIN family toxin of toxin-antitoxin system
MRLVLDTDVVVAAIRSPRGASSALILAAVDRQIQLLANVALVLEYEAVCLRHDHLLAAGLTSLEVQQYVDGLAAIIQPVTSHFIWRPQLKDPGDEMVLEAAVNGMADAIVTFNQRDFGTVPKRFGVEVFLPRDVFIKLHRAQP